MADAIETRDNRRQIIKSKTMSVLDEFIAGIYIHAKLIGGRKYVF